jgi:WD40 repeat protein
MEHAGPVNGAMFSKDENRILTWSGSRVAGPGIARLWDANTGIPIGQPLVHLTKVNGAMFLKDEKHILTWSADGTARLWNADTGSPIGYPMQHKNYVNGAVLSRDEKRILTWGTDSTALLWEAETGIPIGQAMQHNGAVRGAVFFKDEKRILTWSEDGTARLWDVPGDLDFPKDKYVLQVQALTGTKFDLSSRQITVIPIDEWRRIQQEWLTFAREHAKTCQYKRQNVYLRFFATEEK